MNLSISGDVSLSPVPENLKNNYYITVKHRNSIETTSADPVSFAEPDIMYDFSTSASKAYGNNEKSVQGTYVIYGGDENQDGLVDSSDMIDLDNAASSFTVGYLVTDINGDGLVDSSDMILIDNNAGDFVRTILP